MILLLESTQMWLPKWLRGTLRGKFPHKKAQLSQEWVDHFKQQLAKNEFFFPRIIHIETRSLCNGRCHFCAAAVQYNTRPDVTMSDALLDKILNELAERKFPYRVSFYNNNEPFLDKRIYSIVEKARKLLPDAYLELKTNGTAVTYEKVCQIFNSGLDTLYINDYQPTETFLQGTHKESILKLMDQLKKSRRFKGHLDGKGYYSRIILTLRDEGEVLGNRAGTSPNNRGVVAALESPCLRPIEMMTIDPKGNIALCSEDLEFEEKMGNVSEQKLFDIWDSPPYKKVRESLLDGDRSIKKTCAKCDYKGFTFEVLEELVPTKRLFN